MALKPKLAWNVLHIVALERTAGWCADNLRRAKKFD